jgi:hypothetical protein
MWMVAGAPNANWTDYLECRAHILSRIARSLAAAAWRIIWDMCLPRTILRESVVFLGRNVLRAGCVINDALRLG